VADGIARLLSFTEGGAGGVLFRAHDWANRRDTWESYELFARWVMPRFQGSLRMPSESREWCVENRGGIFAPNIAALHKAFADAGHAVPETDRLKLRQS
jgi:limonene 1,2-monooxygenase